MNYEFIKEWRYSKGEFTFIHKIVIEKATNEKKSYKKKIVKHLSSETVDIQKYKSIKKNGRWKEIIIEPNKYDDFDREFIFNWYNTED